jgi:hypothetical protein
LGLARGTRLSRGTGLLRRTLLGFFGDLNLDLALEKARIVELADGSIGL